MAASGTQPRKAPAKKAAAKKAAAKKTAAVLVTSTDPDAAENVAAQPSGLVTKDGQALQTTELTFYGRTMVVQVPDEVQIALMEKFASEYGPVKPGQITSAKQVIRMNRKTIGVIRSVLRDDDDKDWLEDGLMDHRFTLEEAAGIVQEALDLLKVVNAPNRAARREAVSQSRLVTE